MRCKSTFSLLVLSLFTMMVQSSPAAEEDEANAAIATSTQDSTEAQSYRERSGTSQRRAEGSEHRFSLGLSTNYQATEGKFDSYGDYYDNAPGANVWKVSTTLSFGYRFLPDWNLGTSLAFSHRESNYQSGSTSSDTLGGGGIKLGHRLGDIAGLFDLSASAGFNFGLKLYSKRKSVGDPGKDAAASSGEEESTGELGGAGGGKSVSMGLTASRGIGAFRLSGGVSLGVPLSTTIDADSARRGGAPIGTVSRHGTRYGLSESLGYRIDRRWSLSGGFRQNWTGESTENGQGIDGTAARSYTTSLGVAYASSRDLRWHGSFSTPFPFYDYSVNSPYAPSVSLGATYSGL